MDANQADLKSDALQYSLTRRRLLAGIVGTTALAAGMMARPNRTMALRPVIREQRTMAVSGLRRPLREMAISARRRPLREMA